MLYIDTISALLLLLLAHSPHISLHTSSALHSNTGQFPMQVCAAKAGLTARMPARTAVIAAANPIGGTYCRAKSLKENVKMSVALFSRFDLVFAMLDEANEEGDFKLSEHVMSVHCVGKVSHSFSGSAGTANIMCCGSIRESDSICARLCSPMCTLHR
jgi:DNA replicative helicase MCM subunit Mcm2 (Cdc46/Mcm family)